MAFLGQQPNLPIVNPHLFNQLSCLSYGGGQSFAQTEEGRLHYALLKSMIQIDGKGYDPSIFKNQSKCNRYKCGLCKNICYQAVELRCYQCSNEDDDSEDEGDHIYCQLCLNEYLNMNNYTCPLNKNHQNVTFAQCPYIQGKISNLKIYCPTNHGKNHHGINDESEGAHTKDADDQKSEDENEDEHNQCEWTDKLCEVSIHLLNQCKGYQKPIKCKYSKYGCSFVGITESVKKHLENDTGSHLDLLCNKIDQAAIERKQLMNMIQGFQQQLYAQQQWIQTQVNPINSINMNSVQPNNVILLQQLQRALLRQQQQQLQQAQQMQQQQQQNQAGLSSHPLAQNHNVNTNLIQIDPGHNGQASIKLVNKQQQEPSKEEEIKMVEELQRNHSGPIPFGETLPERVFAAVKEIEEENAERVCSLLWEMNDMDQLRDLLENKEGLVSAINECMFIIKEEKQGEIQNK